MSAYDDARDLVIEALDSIIVDATSEYYDGTLRPYKDGTEEAVRGLHVQSIVYRLMDQV